jgi:hypothetical protein
LFLFVVSDSFPSFCLQSIRVLVAVFYIRNSDKR